LQAAQTLASRNYVLGLAAVGEVVIDGVELLLLGIWPFFGSFVAIVFEILR